MADDGEKQLRALCKLFIGGLPRSVTDDELAETFLKFCEDECLNDCVVIKDENKQSRGFGFVTYNRLCDTDNCLANRPHLLQGKEVEVKHAIPREDQNTTNHTRTNKIFVGGFPKDATEEDMTEAIENYTLIIGESLNAKVNKVDIIKSKEGGRAEEVPRGFCFVEMATDDDADKVVIVKNFTVKGKRVEVKKAEPKGAKSGGGGGRGGGRGGSRMGGGGGGYNNFGGGRDNYFGGGGGFGGNDYGGYGGYGGMGGGAGNYFGQMMNDNYGFPAYNQSNSSFGPSRNSNARYGGGNSGGGRGRGGRGGGGGGSGGYRPY